MSAPSKYGAGLIALAISCLALLAPGEALADRQHRVRQGDSLAAIARRYRVSVPNLRAANRMGRSDTIRPGQVLAVPEHGVVFVRPGQTLSHIARENRCTIDALAGENGIRAGSSLRVGQRLWLPGTRETVAESRPRDWGEASEPGVVRLRTFHDDVTLRLRDEDGSVPRGSLEALARVMHRGDESDDAETDVQLPEPRLALILAALSDHFGGRPVRIVSGFREVRGFTRETSRHVQGHAADVALPGVPKRALWDYCRSLAGTGCGLYPRSSFVHVDTRASAAQWVDWSGPGRRPRYGNLRGPFRRRGPRNGESRNITRPDVLPAEARIAEPATLVHVWASAAEP